MRVWLTASCEGPCRVFGPVVGEASDVVVRLMREWDHVRNRCEARVRFVSISKAREQHHGLLTDEAMPVVTSPHTDDTTGQGRPER